MATTFLGTLTGWWSNIFPHLRRPADDLIAAVAAEPGIATMQRHWRKWPDIADHLASVRYRRIVIYGHSYGASAATHLAADLDRRGIAVDLFISADQGLDSIFIRDVPVTRNVRRVDEMRVAYERLKFVPGWAGEHNFEQVGRPSILRHTSTFTAPAMVERLARRVIGVHRA